MSDTAISRLDTEYNSQADTKEILRFIEESGEGKVEETEKELTTYISSMIVVDSVISIIDNEIENNLLPNRSIILPMSQENIEEGEEEEKLSEKEKEELALLNLTLMMEEKHRLIKELKDAYDKRDIIMEERETFEIKLVLHFKRKRPDASSKMIKQLQEKDSTIVDNEEKYDKYLLTVMNLQNQLQITISEMEIITEIKESQMSERDTIMSEQHQEFLKYQQKIGSMAANSNTGRRIPSQDLEQLYTLESRKDIIVAAVRLENIKLQNEVIRLSSNLFAKESLTKKLNLVDFEQLKIENFSFHGKLEERNDSISRLTERIKNNAHKISHLKEKLRCVFMESKVEDEKQKNITKKFNLARKKITKEKYERDEVLNLNKKIVQSGGLLRHKTLLHHFQYTLDNLRTQQDRVRTLAFDYELSLTNERKIEEKIKFINKIKS